MNENNCLTLGMKAPDFTAMSTYDELLRRVSGEEGYNCVDWYLCFKNI